MPRNVWNFSMCSKRNFFLELVRSAPFAGSAPWVGSLCKRGSMKPHKTDLTHLPGSTPESGHCVNAVIEKKGVSDDHDGRFWNLEIIMANMAYRPTCGRKTPYIIQTIITFLPLGLVWDRWASDKRRQILTNIKSQLHKKLLPTSTKEVKEKRGKYEKIRQTQVSQYSQHWFLHPFNKCLKINNKKLWFFLLFL